MAALRTYFETLSEAKEESRKLVPAGNTLNEDDFAQLQSVNYGETGSVHARMITPKGNEAQKCLHVSIYRMESGRYELTAYIN